MRLDETGVAGRINPYVPAKRSSTLQPDLNAGVSREERLLLLSGTVKSSSGEKSPNTYSERAQLLSDPLKLQRSWLA